jgi:DNA-binding NtrC family response regulator
MDKICKVLIVEDDQEIRNLFHSVFLDEGYHAAVAGDGEAARGILDADDTVDLVIADIVLPQGPDGFVLANEAARRGHRVIVITGDHRFFERLEKSGHRYLLKPFSTNSLLQAVKDELACSKKLHPPD